MAKAAYVWDGTQFVSVNVPVGAVPNAVVYYNSASPSGPTTGHMWIDSDDTILYVWNGTSWVVASSSGGGATGGGSNKAFYENDTNVTANYTITAGKNAMTAGPITINSGVTVTIPSGSVWTVV